MLSPLLCEAIAGRQIVRFYYEGGFRAVEPHIYGLSNDAVEFLLGYQTSGVSSSDKPVGWKRFRVEKMETVSVSQETFAQNRPEYDPNDNVIKTVFCQL